MTRLRRRGQRWLLGCAAGVALAGAQAAEPPLSFGLAPNVSPRTILTSYQPLRLHLQVELHRPVELYTAPDFATFYQRATRGDYDLFLIPAHMARLAQLEAGAQPLAQFARLQEGLVLVRRGGPIRHVADLQGKTVAFADPLAIVTLRGKEWLSAQGLKVNSAARALPYFTHHDAALLAVVQGNADAAIVSSVPFSLAPAEVRANLDPIASIGTYPANVFMGAKRLSPAEASRLTAALTSLGRSAGQGPAFLARHRLEAIVPLRPADLKAMDTYARQVREPLRAAASAAEETAVVPSPAEK